MTMAVAQLLVQTDRVGEQAEQDEEPDLGDPPHRRREALERRPVGQAHVAEDERREVGREEPRHVDGGAHGIREHGEREDADREEGGRAAGHAAQRQPAEIADRDADDGSTRELEHGDDEQLHHGCESRPACPGRRRRRRG